MYKKTKQTLSSSDNVTNLTFFMALEVSETEIEEMFDVADTDRDGIIGYPEFMVRCT